MLLSSEQIRFPPVTRSAQNNSEERGKRKEERGKRKEERGKSPANNSILSGAVRYFSDSHPLPRPLITSLPDARPRIKLGNAN
jgi:hypothetical protein